MVRKRISLAVLLLACTPLAGAQRGGGAHGFPTTAFGNRGRYPGYGRAIFFADPFFYDDYPYSSLTSPPAPPQIVVIQSTPSGDPQPAPKIEPLLIELQGGQYVRVGEASSQRANSERREAGTLAANNPLAPAVLIYRDGHSEQVADYAIIDGVMYARGNYWQNGYWNKPIQISALNLSATIQANREHGVNFVLPSGPYEVVTRP